MWLSKLKIALVQKDIDSLNDLVKDLPTFTNKKDIQEAMYLSREVVSVFQTLKDETELSMKLIKKNLEFLKSTHINTATKLDITS